MKFVDNIIEKFGVDKVLHFVTGGFITSLFGFFGIIPIIIGVIVTFGISLLKEKVFDIQPDKNDIIAAMLGSALSLTIYTISLVL